MLDNLANSQIKMWIKLFVKLDINIIVKEESKH